MTPRRFPAALALLVLLAGPLPAAEEDAAPTPEAAETAGMTAGSADIAFHDHVVVVLDASGSMDGALPDGKRKMDAAKEALRAALEGLPPSTRVGIVVFSAANLSDPWIYPVGPLDERKLAAAIARPEPGGGTPLGEYIKVGADALLEARAKSFGYGSYRLLVVTDGEAHDPDLVDRYTADVMSRGITFHAIGVGMKGDHTLARKVHSYRAANDAAALRDAVAEVFAEVSAQGSGAVTPEDFELLAGLPAETADAMVRALAQSGNHPIGVSAAEAAAQAQAGLPGVPGTPPAGPSGGGGPSSGASVVVFFILFIVVVNVFEKLAKALRGKK